MKYRRQSGNFQFEEDPFSKNSESISKIYHDVSLLMKFIQTKPQVKNMKSYYDLYYTIIKNRDDKEIVSENEYENDKVYNKFDDFIYPNQYNGRKNDNELLK